MWNRLKKIWRLSEPEGFKWSGYVQSANESPSKKYSEEKINENMSVFIPYKRSDPIDEFINKANPNED